MDRPLDPEKLNWEKMGGLVPTVVQDHRTGRVLMLAFMNTDALEKSLSTGLATFWSRTRQELWTKGETSGNGLRIREIRHDCDADSLLLLVEPDGPACHRGTVSCFGGDADHCALEFLGVLERVIRSRRTASPEGSYTSRLFAAGPEEIVKKLGEEAIELIVSASQEKRRTVEEAADLFYHLLVFLADRNVVLDEVMAELARRHEPACGEPA